MSDVFDQLAELSKQAQKEVLPRITEEYVHAFFLGKFDELDRDIEFLERETRKYRSTNAGR